MLFAYTDSFNCVPFCSLHLEEEKVSVKVEGDTPDSKIDPANVKVQAAEDLRKILKMAWRPAWSMRSRRGSLAPFIDWWQRRKNAPKKP